MGKRGKHNSRASKPCTVKLSLCPGTPKTVNLTEEIEIVKDIPVVAASPKDPLLCKILTWTRPPSTVWVLRKYRDPFSLDTFFELTDWLREKKGLKLAVEKDLLKDPDLQAHKGFRKFKSKVVLLDGTKVDLIVVVGDDGTVKEVSKKFTKDVVPPVIGFSSGTLGYLTPFGMENFQDKIERVLAGNVSLTLRSRLKCDFHRPGKCSSVYSTTVLNQVVVERGLCNCNPSNVSVRLDGVLATNILAEALVISTATGSTGHAATAGGPMTHPTSRVTYIGAVCPPTLSFRPLEVPDDVKISIRLCPKTQKTAGIVFDGYERLELYEGAYLTISKSPFPLAIVCAEGTTRDWLRTLQVRNWNGMNTNSNTAESSVVLLGSPKAGPITHTDGGDVNNVWKTLLEYKSSLKESQESDSNQESPAKVPTPALSSTSQTSWEVEEALTQPLGMYKSEPCVEPPAEDASTVEDFESDLDETEVNESCMSLVDDEFYEIVTKQGLPHLVFNQKEIKSRLDNFVVTQQGTGPEVKCFITRHKKGAGGNSCPTFFMKIDLGQNEQMLILTAWKRKKLGKTSYLIATNPSYLNQEGAAWIGKLSSNRSGNRFKIQKYSRIMATEPFESDKEVVEEIGAISYETDPHGPRKMNVYIPTIMALAHEENTEGGDQDMGLDSKVQLKGIVELTRKTPRWNAEHDAFVLDFGGDVEGSKVSIKNFQLIQEGFEDHIILQFGRFGKDLFKLSYRHPFCPIQAFATALSRFEQRS